MNHRQATRDAQRISRSFVAGLLVALVGLPVASGALAHEVWIETAASGQVGQGQEVRVCWGHSGHRESGEGLQRQQSKLIAWCVAPDSQSKNLPLLFKSDCLTATVTPAAPGAYVLGAECQTGILDREFHGMAAKTRIVMAGKTVFRAGPGVRGIETPLRIELDLVPGGDILDLHPGDVVAAKVLFKKKPIGGRTVVATLSTLGSRPFPKDPGVEGLAWSTKNTAAPGTGEVRFPLIAAGRHILSVRYTDETPGRYEGDLEFTSKFSHLRKGDSYERTMHVSTLTFEVLRD